MSKILLIESLSTPDMPGYLDKLAILTDNIMGFHCQCSACPNEFQPATKERPRSPWIDVYGWVACNTKETPYTWECFNDTTTGKGKCLSVNCRGKVPTRYIDKKNKAMYALGVLIHCGFSATWRGSAACITLPPLVWPSFIERFAMGEKGLLYISDFNKPIVLTQS